MSRERDTFLPKRTTNPHAAFLYVTKGNLEVPTVDPLNPEFAAIATNCVSAGIAFPVVSDIRDESDEAQTTLQEGKALVTLARPDKPGTILIPPSFIRDAHQTPISALATLVEVGSLVRDAMYGRQDEPENYVHRARAYNAEFVLDVMGKYPETVLDEDLWGCA